MTSHHMLIIKYQFDEIIEKDYLYEQRLLMHPLIDECIYQILLVFLKQVIFIQKEFPFLNLTYHLLQSMTRDENEIY